MRSTILSVSKKAGINYLIQTVLSTHYHIILSTNVFDACTKIREIRNIKLVILDIDDKPEECGDFISHIGSSSIYNLPFIVLHTGKKELLENSCEFKFYKSFQKPFNPLHLTETVHECVSKKTADKVQ